MDDFFAEAKEILESEGFTEESPALMGYAHRAFHKDTQNESLKIGARCRDGTIDLALYPEPNQQQGDIGTVHRAHGISALKTNISSITTALEALAANPERLKCPDCKERYVYLTETGPYGPFLSCEAMRGSKPHACRGKSKRIPALRKYP